jgi:tripartite-type tricarboxylate transporter receptor subunit TctC
VTSGVDIGRPYFVGPRVPRERVDLLRAAFDRMVRDPGFLAAAKAGRLALSPTRGVELQDLVERTMHAPSDIVAKTRAALILPRSSGVGR